jgi:hypothetical protein
MLGRTRTTLTNLGLSPGGRAGLIVYMRKVP